MLRRRDYTLWDHALNRACLLTLLTTRRLHRSCLSHERPASAY